MHEVVHLLYKEKGRVQTLRRTLDQDAVRFQQERILYEEKAQELLGNLQAEATKRARFEEDLRVNTIQKKQCLSREQRLEAKLAEAEVTIGQLRECRGCRCAICYEGICDTVTACGHQLCWECFVSWHREQSRDLVFLYTCPLCRTVLGSRGDSAPSMAMKLHAN